MYEYGKVPQIYTLSSMTLQGFKGLFRSRACSVIIQSHFSFLVPSPRKMCTSINLQLIALINITAASALAADSNLTTCYFVNGDLASQHVLCFPDKVSAGGNNTYYEKSNDDVYHDIGICLSMRGMTYQEACTDQNW